MWRAVTLVSSGITLVAFIVAVAAWVYRSTILQKERQIRHAPAAERGALIENALEFFKVDTVGLSSRQQYNLAVKQIHERAMRFRTTAFVVIVLAALTAGVSSFALWQEKKTNPLPPNNVNTINSAGSADLPVPSVSANSLQSSTPFKRQTPIVSHSPGQKDDRGEREKNANAAINRPPRPTPD